MTARILTISFYILFAFTPLFWSPLNFELFEYNKMMLVYALTLIITFFWLMKMMNQKKLIFKRTPLDLPLLLFLLANILSTMFSIDTHTSIWGYYSRSNGGLLSIISYTLLYYALVSNFESAEALKFLKAAILGGLMVALWAIPEHFGVSPSCIILTGEFNASCWVQDVQARVFATLGQPNWLAAYLAMLIFPTLYFFLTSTKKSSILTFAFCLFTFYLAFTFTYSRGATLGLLGGLVVFLSLFAWQSLHSHLESDKLNLAKPLSLIFLAFILINLIFGSALTDFKLLSKFAAPPRPALTEAAVQPQTTQLESGGTESGSIRLIVWKGALEIFKHYPVFGSGVETFAYAYYNFRPQEHNLVSEWDFLYNKAHNEFLNYLATTGVVGLATYLAVIIIFIVCGIKYIVYRGKQKNLHTPYSILYTSLLASYSSFLVQNFFGFSVVITALFFYLFPALIFTVTRSAQAASLPLFLFKPIFKVVFTILTIIGLIILSNYYLADIYFAKANRANELSEPAVAYEYISKAVDLNSAEPYYQSELGYLSAVTALSLGEEESTLSAQFTTQAVFQTEKVLEKNPYNVSYFRTAIRTYYILSNINSTFTKKSLEVFDRTIALAPTDAKLYYNKGMILRELGENQKAVKALEKAVELRPFYQAALLLLGSAYFDLGEKEKAKQQMKVILKFIPDDPGAREKLQEWEAK